jgi:hypothetical protein
LRSADNVIEQIEFEIGQIDRLLEVYADLLTRVQHKSPDAVEMAAVASVLHSFYNGLENVFSSVAKGIDGDVPGGSGLHSSLLKRMMLPGISRPPLLSQDNGNRLVDYLGFRHFYRHSYTFFLDWEKVGELVSHLIDVWSQVRGEIISFCRDIKNAP